MGNRAVQVCDQSFFGTTGNYAGVFLNGGYLKFFVVGTSTPQAIYTAADKSGSTVTQVSLNTVGMPSTEVFWDGILKVEIYDADDVLQDTLTDQTYYVSGFPNGSFVSLTDYNGGALEAATWNAAISDIGSDEVTLLVTQGTWVIDANVTVPKNIDLFFVGGALLSISTSYTFTINSSIRSGFHKIFTLNGTGIVSYGTSFRGPVIPHWYGAKGDNSNDDTSAIQAALDTLKSVYLAGGIYVTSSTLYFYAGGAQFYGDGVANTSIQPNGSFVGLILGNKSTTSQTIHDSSFSDIEILGGTYPLQVGNSSASPQTYLGSINRIRVKNGSSDGCLLDIGIASFNDCEFINNSGRGLATLTTGGASTHCSFNQCRFYQNTLEGVYLEYCWSFRFYKCDFETNGRDGFLGVKTDGTQWTDCVFDHCWVENNHTDGTYTSTRGNYTFVAGSTTKCSKVRFMHCQNNGVNGYATGVNHVYGSLDSISFYDNYYINPSANAITMTNSNVTGYAFGTAETFSSSGKILRITSDITIPEGDLILQSGILNATATRESHIIKGASLSDGDSIASFRQGSSNNYFNVSYLACGPDSDRIGIRFDLQGTGLYRVWVDDSGDLRIYNANPTANNSGTVVGTQTFTGTHIYKLNHSYGENSLEIGSAVSLVNGRIEPSLSKEDKRCVGIFAGKSCKLFDSFGVKEEDSDYNYAVISLGDSRFNQNNIQTIGILVCDEGGNIEAGDYLCTSSTAGYFMKQSDDLMHNYTVAQAQEDCDFTDGKNLVYGYVVK